ncbi:flagellar motor protein MotB [uncultured Gimesia sp.]|uniref:OmpA/MotB family protein n=1 Tax=uncultured Gimesia sp. TaxID=1678688 RepID=UPI0030DC32A3|tara:strand:- start:33699 stop:34415 length:717 start_codon:yes stop_codon:yes gene_type:complete
MEDDDPPGVPEWVVTYGDMMSLLLTFFIMLVSLSEIVNDEKFRAVLESIQNYSGYRTGPVSPPGKYFPMNSLVEQMSMLGAFTDSPDRGRGGIKTRALEGKDVRVYRTREGVPVKVGEALHYNQTDIALDADRKEKLDEIIPELAGKPNKIELRSHTSIKPLPADCPIQDKLVLTYDRGRNVMLYLIQKGIAPKRIRITAASDYEPPLKTGDEKSEQMDRLDVLLLDAFVNDYVGPRK